MVVFDKHRKRRIIYNDDSDQQFLKFAGYPYEVTDEQSFLDCRTTPVFDTHVDTYAWCVGNGCDPSWRDQRLGIRPALGSSERASDMIVSACHAHGIEVWGSLRMNDIHDASRATLDEASERFKIEHPECLIAPQSNRDLPLELAERNQWTVLDFANSEVRRHRLDFITKNAAAHDFDAYELDFTRHTYFFRLGEEREHTNEMTELVRDVRSALNAIGERRGRSYGLIVHGMDSIEGSLNLGLDVITWAKEGLVDVFVVGTGYLPYVMPSTEWFALRDGFDIPIYPSVNTNAYADWWQHIFKRPTAWHEAIRAGAAYYWQEGFDGQYIFNLFCMEELSLGPLERDFVYAPLSEIGEPSAMVAKNKIYSIQPVAQSGHNARFGSDPTPLPIALDRKERKLPLMIGPDAKDPNARFVLSVHTLGRLDGRRFWLRLNHRLLDAPARDQNRMRADVPKGLLRPGKNELSILCDVAAATTEDPIIVHEVYVEATYST